MNETNSKPLLLWKYCHILGHLCVTECLWSLFEITSIVHNFFLYEQVLFYSVKQLESKWAVVFWLVCYSNKQRQQRFIYTLYTALHRYGSISSVALVVVFFFVFCFFFNNFFFNAPKWRWIWNVMIQGQHFWNKALYFA